MQRETQGKGSWLQKRAEFAGRAIAVARLPMPAVSPDNR
jgi:hypothetical protein